MTKDLNEDLIEATIRRVAEARAAQAADAGEEPAVSEAAEAAPAPAIEAGAEATEPATPAVDEDRIAATIRRVAEARAALASGTEEVPPPVEHVEAGQNGTPADAPAALHPAPASLSPVDEDRIAATMRRVAEARSAMTSGSADEPVPPEHLEATKNGAVDTGAATRDALPASPPTVDEDRIAATIRRVAEAREAQARVGHAPVEAEGLPERRDRPTPALARPSILPPAAGGEGWEQAVADLRRELNETQRELRALARRLDEAQALTNAPQSGVAAAPVAGDGDADWDEAPQLPRVPIGQAPRPAIFYNPSPQTATAEHLQSEPDTVIDTPPPPKPLPTLHAETRRGLDLLPRTYRITVEDKRRGVDLVPLHRALLGMDGVRDMSLLSYSNGVAIVSIEMADELDASALESAVARAMSRPAKVEVHNDTTMVVKLAEE